MSNISRETSIYDLFKSMNFSEGIVSNSSAVSWLEKHEKTFFGFVDGYWLSKEKVEEELKSVTDFHKVCDVFTGKHLCDIYTSVDNNLLSYAAKIAHVGFITWCSMSPRSRSKILFNIAQTIEKYQQLFATIEAVSSGKHFSQVKKRDVPNLIESFNYYAGCTMQLENKTKSWFSTGPVCIIAEEYNNPCLTLSLRVSSILASGNSIVLLTDVKSSLCSFLLAEICCASGLPKGVLNVIPIDQTNFKAEGISNFSKVVFTGSFQKSLLYSHFSADSHVSCEVLIPRRPIIIVYETGDLYAAANGVVEAFFHHDTRSKSGGCKVMIQDSIHKKFLTILNERFTNIHVGQNMSKTDMSCIVTKEQKKILTECIEEAEKIHAKVISMIDTESETFNYSHMMPVLISNLQTNSQLVYEEMGGPIIVTLPFRTVKESVSMFNCDNKGCPVSIWSETVSVALEVAQKLKTGVVWVNSENTYDAKTAYSGVYLSGNSIEGGKDALYHHMSVTSSTGNISNEIEKCETWLLSSNELQKSPPYIQGENKIVKEYKLFIGGNLKCSDKGSVLHNESTLIPSATESDVKNAVSHAVAAQPKWEFLSDLEKRKIFFAVIDKLKKAEECIYELDVVPDSSLDERKKEFAEALDLLYYLGTQNDKCCGSTQELKRHLMVLQNRNPLGVIGIQCPDKKPLLSFILSVFSAIASGNTVVAITSTKYPTVALKMCEVFSSAGIPNGVVNVICGNNTLLVPALCRHTGVNAIWFTDAPLKVIYSNCNVTQKVFCCDEIWTNFNEVKNFKCVMECTYNKVIFLHSGGIFAN